MSDEGKSGSRSLAPRLFLVLLLTLVPISIAAWLLTFAYLVDNTLRAQSLLVTGGCFSLGSLLLVFSGITKEKVLLWFCGFIVTGVILLLSALQLLMTLIPLAPVEIGAVVVMSSLIGLYLYSRRISTSQDQSTVSSTDVFSFSRLRMTDHTVVGGVEIVEMPEDYLAETVRPASSPERFIPFYGLLRALLSSDIPLALRIERVLGKTRAFYLTWAKRDSDLAEHIMRLEDNLRAKLPGFRFRAHSSFSGPEIGSEQTAVASYLHGEPLSIEDTRQQKDAITELVEVLQRMSSGIIQISATPRQSSARELKSLEDAYGRETQRSQTTISNPKSGLFSGEVQESTTRVNMKAVRKAETIRKQIERKSKRTLCEVTVATLCWDRDKAEAERQSRRLLTTLRGSVLPADDERDLSITSSANVTDTARLLRGESTGKSTLLSVDEAAVYFVFPRNDIGIPVVDHAAFRSNPAALNPPREQSELVAEKKRPALKIGRILDDAGQPIGDFELIIDDLASHSGIYGDTGTGKTTTQLCILNGLQSKKIGYLVALASKNDDYLRHLGTKKSVYIFTIGDETTAPGRFSLTGFHEGVHVNSIIDCIKTVFVAAKPCEGMIKEYLEALVELTFKRMGWDRDTNRRGLPLILQDFLEMLPLMEKELQYSTRGNEDFWGALYGRVRSMSTGPLARIFGTVSGISIEELTGKQCILLLDRISKDERSFFMYWLITNLALHFDAEKRSSVESTTGLKYYVVLEEAHEFLSGAQGVKQEEGHGAQAAAIQTIGIAVKESRSAGLGFSFATQSASQLSKEVHTTVMNIFMHRKNTKSERELIGDQMNCNVEQVIMMGALPTGQAVVRTASSSKPVRVQIDSPSESNPASGSKGPVTDAHIRRHMEPVFKANPHFREYHAFTRNEPDVHPHGQPVLSMKLDMLSMVRAHIIAEHPTFRDMNNVLTEVTQSGSSLLTALILHAVAQLATHDEAILPLCCLRLLRSYSQRDDPMPKEVTSSIAADLAGLVSGSESLLTADLETLHERLNIECARRAASIKVDEGKTGALIQQAVKSAIAEFTERPQQRLPAAIPFNLESDLSRTIEGVVTTDEFATKYLERMEKAIAGDVGPLVRLVEVFSKRIAGPDCTLAEVSSSLLHYARTAHRTPEDDTIWNRVFMEVQSKIVERGSESAT